jgi:hypothetical protein
MSATAVLPTARPLAPSRTDLRLAAALHDDLRAAGAINYRSVSAEARVAIAEHELGQRRAAA